MKRLKITSNKLVLLHEHLSHVLNNCRVYLNSDSVVILCSHERAMRVRGIIHEVAIQIDASIVINESGTPNRRVGAHEAQISNGMKKILGINNEGRSL